MAKRIVKKIRKAIRGLRADDLAVLQLEDRRGLHEPFPRVAQPAHQHRRVGRDETRPGGPICESFVAALSLLSLRNTPEQMDSRRASAIRAQ